MSHVTAKSTYNDIFLIDIQQVYYLEMLWFVILFFSKRDVLSFVCLWGQIEGNPNINIDGSSDVNGHKNTRWRERPEIISYLLF